MALHLTPNQAATVEASGNNAALPAPKAADDLAVLHPERTLTIGGAVVTLREYSFVDGLKLRGLYAPFFDALYARIEQNDFHAPTLDVVESVVAEHLDALITLISHAAGVEEAWVRGLNDEDGHELMNAWWLVNAHFFIRRVSAKIALTKVKAKKQAESSPDGQTSTTDSSSPDTAKPQPTSAG